MIQLSFEPAYDTFHAAFRALRIVAHWRNSGITLDRLKILDVFVVEPRRCLEVRLVGPLKKAARAAAKLQPPTYGQRPATTTLFNRMSPMQDAAIQTLVMQGYLDADAFKVGRVMRTEQLLPDSIQQRISEKNQTFEPLMQFLTALDEIPMNGPKGLKSRTGIGEYRYDNV